MLYTAAGIGRSKFRDSETTFYEHFLRVPEKKSVASQMEV